MSKNFTRVMIAAALISVGFSVAAQVSAGPLRERVIRLPKVTSTITTMGAGALAQDRDLEVITCKTNRCEVPVEVTVDTKEVSGRTCAFAYPDVVVTKNKKTEIVWILTEKNSAVGAKFRDDFGGQDGIRIYRGTKGQTHFKNRKFQNMEFGWERDEDTADSATAYFYDIAVDHSFGGRRCDVPDPIIVNRD